MITSALRWYSAAYQSSETKPGFVLSKAGVILDTCAILVFKMQASKLPVIFNMSNTYLPNLFLWH